MSIVSYTSGARYLSLIGGTCLSFYDWYCDLPPASPQTWGEQTDVPESADWYNSSYIIAWGSTLSRRVPRMLTSLLKCVTKGPKLSSHQTTLKSPNCDLAGTETGHRCGNGAGDGPRNAA
ncbi:molybdopterin-dependent oxidoreductase [Escherichia coli]